MNFKFNPLNSSRGKNTKTPVYDFRLAMSTSVQGVHANLNSLSGRMLVFSLLPVGSLKQTPWLFPANLMTKAFIPIMPLPFTFFFLPITRIYPKLHRLIHSSVSSRHCPWHAEPPQKCLPHELTSRSPISPAKFAIGYTPTSLP